MLHPTTPDARSLGGGLTLRSVSDEADIERVAAFNALIHGPSVEGMTRNMILHHPHTRPEHWLFVDDDAGRVVSSLCLIPWTLRYGPATLRSGEMGIVGTLPDFRHGGRSLVAALIERFDELLIAGEFDLTHIQGIPYYYRRYGYDYALPLEPHLNLELRSIPDALAGEDDAFAIRAAEERDIPALAALYDAAVHELDLSTVRDEATWRYLLAHTAGTAMEADTWLTTGAGGGVIGYWRVAREGFGEGLIVSEASRLPHRAAQAALRHLKGLAQARGKPYIRLNLAAGSSLARTAQAWGAYDDGGYEWQIRVVDVPRLLTRLAPALEQRLADSPFAGLSETVLLSLYREAFALRFENGTLSGVESVGFTLDGAIKLPPTLLPALVLGHRDRHVLRATYPDFAAWGQAGYLLDVLFPPMRSFLYTIY